MPPLAKLRTATEIKSRFRFGIIGASFFHNGNRAESAITFSSKIARRR
jgi:hypothetical protein